MGSGVSSNTDGGYMVEVNDNSSDVPDYVPAWTNCSIDHDAWYTVENNSMPTNLRNMGFTWIWYESRGGDAYTFRFRASKATIYYICDDDVENYGDKVNPLTGVVLGGDVYKKSVVDISNEHSIALHSPHPRIKYICRDICSQKNGMDIEKFGGEFNSQPVYARVWLPAILDDKYQKIEGDALPKSLRDMGIEWIQVGNSHNPIYDYFVEFKARVHATFSFRDSDSSETDKNDSLTDRVMNGDVYHCSVDNVDNDHIVRFNSKNPNIVEVGRSACTEADTALPAEKAFGLR